MHGYHSFIVIASTNEYTRKIFNSPQYAEPCLVYSAKQVLCADNWSVAEKSPRHDTQLSSVGSSSTARNT